MYRERNFSGASQVFKSVLVSVVSCFVLTFLYALILRIFSLGDGGIRIVNSVIKVLSVFLGVFLFIRDEKGLLKGAISGGISLLLTSFAVSLAV
ncbi:MAG: YrzE family protein, partial [Clostridia bacterium]|nr:YrzE family protein [Clostridia bacterium]